MRFQQSSGLKQTPEGGEGTAEANSGITFPMFVPKLPQITCLTRQINLFQKVLEDGL